MASAHRHREPGALLAPVARRPQGRVHARQQSLRLRPRGRSRAPAHERRQRRHPQWRPVMGLHGGNPGPRRQRLLVVARQHADCLHALRRHAGAELPHLPCRWPARRARGPALSQGRRRQPVGEDGRRPRRRRTHGVDGLRGEGRPLRRVAVLVARQPDAHRAVDEPRPGHAAPVRLPARYGEEDAPHRGKADGVGRLVQGPRVPAERRGVRPDQRRVRLGADLLPRQRRGEEAAHTGRLARQLDCRRGREERLDLFRRTARQVLGRAVDARASRRLGPHAGHEGRRPAPRPGVAGRDVLHRRGQHGQHTHGDVPQPHGRHAGTEAGRRGVARNARLCVGTRGALHDSFGRRPVPVAGVVGAAARLQSGQAVTR